jgi:hypothetical protein
MTSRSTLWRIVAALFTAVNLVGIGFAAAAGEGRHTAAHVVLAILGAYWMWRIAPRTTTQSGSTSQSERDRLEQLQQSMDAVALEVERIGEAQRFQAKLEQERIEPKD